MSIKRLKQYIDQERPVICSLQAYSEDEPPDYAKERNGHYVVAIGYRAQGTFYLHDPLVRAHAPRLARPTWRTGQRTCCRGRLILPVVAVFPMRFVT